MATTVVKPKPETLEQLAESTIRNHLRHNPGLEIVPITCAVDKRQVHAPSHDDVHAFLKTLDQDEGFRFDVSDAEAPDEFVHAQPEEDKVDIDDQEPLILARRVRYHWQYVAGLSRTGRVLF